MQIELSELAALLGNRNQSAPTDFGSDYKIVVLDKGFVVHGRVRRDGCYLVIEDCNQIRYWGTPNTKNDSALGLLARTGPTTETKLDRQPTTRVHELQVVQLIDCEKGGPWNAR